MYPTSLPKQGQSKNGCEKYLRLVGHLKDSTYRPKPAAPTTPSTRPTPSPLVNAPPPSRQASRILVLTEHRLAPSAMHQRPALTWSTSDSDPAARMRSSELYPGKICRPHACASRTRLSRRTPGSGTNAVAAR